MTSHVFLSYSRSQFYFAESLALHLNKLGLPVWFDVHQLSPGSDWSQGIQQGLISCSSVILVASRASLSSPYVTNEWKSALAAGKPIYVVIFEEVEFPKELTPAAVVDFRVNFNRSVKRLTESISEKLVAQDSVPRPNKYNIPRRVPFSVLLVVVALCLSAINITYPALMNLFTMLGSGLQSTFFGALFPNLPGAGVLGQSYFDWANRALFYKFLFTDAIFIGIGLFYGYTALKFLRRDFSYRTIRFILPSAIVIAFFVGLLFLGGRLGSLFSGLTQDPGQNTTPYAGLAFLPILCLFNLISFWLPIIAFFVLGGSDSVYRWLPMGQASEKRRAKHGRRFGISLRSAEPEQQGQATQYIIHHAPADGRVAARIRKEMEAAGHIPVAPGQEAAHAIAVLSNETPISMVRSWIVSQREVVPLLVTGVDVSEVIPEVSRYQWVDYRRQAKSHLKALAQYFRRPELGGSAYGLSVLPESLTKHIIPGRVFIFAMILRLWAIYSIASRVEQLLYTLELLPLPVVVFSSALPRPMTIVFYSLSIFLAGLLFLIANQVVERRISAWMCIGVVLSALVGDFVIPALVTGESLFLFDQYRILAVVISIFCLPALLNWLPVEPSQRSAEPTLAAGTSRFWVKGLRDLMVVLAITIFNIALVIPNMAEVTLNNELSFQIPATWNTQLVKDGNLTAAVENMIKPPQATFPFEDAGMENSETAPFSSAGLEIADMFAELNGLHSEMGRPLWIALDAQFGLYVIIMRGDPGNAGTLPNDAPELLNRLAEKIQRSDASKGTPISTKSSALPGLEDKAYDTRGFEVLTTFAEGDPYIFIHHRVVTLDTSSSGYLIHVARLQAAPATSPLSSENFAETAPALSTVLETQERIANKITFNLNPVIRRFLNSIEIQK